MIFLIVFFGYNEVLADDHSLITGMEIGSTSLSKVRGSLLVSELEVNSSRLIATQVEFVLSKVSSITVKSPENGFEINNSEIGYLNYTTVKDIDKIIINSSYQSNFSLYSRENKGNIEFSGTEKMSLSFKGDGLRSHRSEFSAYTYTSFTGYFSSDCMIYVFYSNGTSPDIIKDNSGDVYDFAMQGCSFDFIGVFGILMDEGAFVGFGTFVYMDNTDFSHSCYMKLTDCFGNFTVGPDEFTTTGFDEVVMYNSFSDIEDQNNIGSNISMVDWRGVRPFNVSFEYLNYKTHISQLILNGEIMYDSTIVLREAPATRITLDGSKESELQLYFEIYNPSMYDIFNIEAIFTQELGGLFDASFSLSNKTINYQSDYRSFKIPYLPSQELLECTFTINEEDFKNRKRLEGQIIFLGSNIKTTNMDLVISYKNFLLSITSVLESPVLLPLVPIIMSLFGIYSTKILRLEKEKKKFLFFRGLFTLVLGIGIFCLIFIGILVQRFLGLGISTEVLTLLFVLLESVFVMYSLSCIVTKFEDKFEMSLFDLITAKDK